MVMRVTGMFVTEAKLAILKRCRAKIVIYDLEKDVRYTLTQKWDRSPDSLAASVFEPFLNDNLIEGHSSQKKAISYILLLGMKLKLKFGRFPFLQHPMSLQLILLYHRSTQLPSH